MGDPARVYWRVVAKSLGIHLYWHSLMTPIGMLFIYAGKLFERLPARGNIVSILPAFRALFISLIGLGIVATALIAKVNRRSGF